MQANTHLSSFSDSCPFLRLVSHFTENEAIQIVYRDSNGNTYIHNVREIHYRRDIIQNFSPKDAYLLGYLLGCDDQRGESPSA